jgi:hypothetical protein
VKVAEVLVEMSTDALNLRHICDPDYNELGGTVHYSALAHECFEPGLCGSSCEEELSTTKLTNRQMMGLDLLTVPPFACIPQCA